MRDDDNSEDEHDEMMEAIRDALQAELDKDGNLTWKEAKRALKKLAKKHGYKITKDDIK